MRYIFIVITITLLFACKSTKEATKEVVNETVAENIEKGAQLLSYQRGACYGRCPVFTLEVFENGVLEYFGRNYTDKEGLWQLNISKAKQNKIKNLINKADFQNLKINYESNIPDLPRTTFKYYGDGDEKSVSGKENMPESLTPLQEFLNELINSNKWKKIEGEEKKEEPEFIYSEILVKFKRNSGLANWLRAKEHFWLKGKVGPDSDIWILSYKKSELEPDEALKLIKEDPAVESAQFNSFTKIRE